MELNDIVTKNFESYADVAADIVNALLHEGTVVVTGDEMLTAATESLYADSTNTLHNQLGDVAKYHGRLSCRRKCISFRPKSNS